MRGIDLEVAFSLNKQSAIGTAIAAAAIDRKLPYTTFAPMNKEYPDAISDKDWYGKGHSFATFWDPVTERFVVPNREYSLSPLSALFAFAFVLGDLTTTNPSTAQPTVFDHKFVFQDPATSEECLYTSFIEKLGGVEQNLISGAVLEQFTLTGALKDHVKIGWQGFARDMVVNAASLPGLTAVTSFLTTLGGTFTFGASASLADVSAKIIGWNLTAVQGASQWWLPGQSVANRKKINKAKIGKQGISGQIQLLFESTTERALFKAGTECGLGIVLTGNEIAGGLYESITLSIPHYKIPSESFGEEQDQATLTLPFTEQTVLKAVGDDYFSATVRCTEDATKLLVAA